MSPVRPFPFAEPPPTPAFSRGDAAAPLLTISIPCYNRPRLLAEALAAIAAFPERDEVDVVVSDDGNLPETREVVERSAVPNLRFFVNRPALGPVPNWNRGIALARAPWVTVLHEDDLLYPWFVTTIRPHLEGDAAAVSVRCVQGPTPPLLAAPTGAVKVFSYRPSWYLKASTSPFPGIVIRRETALALGGFDPRQEGLADYAFWYELACRGGMKVIRANAAFYRVNEGQWTERAWPTMLRRAHLLRLRIAREQLPDRPALGRWIARYYTARMARAYARRFSERPAVLHRAQQFARIPFSALPSGWVWAALQRLPAAEPR